MTITLYQIAKLFTYAAIFCVLVVLPSTFFPFIGGKYFFFRFMVELALIFLILWWAFEAPQGVLEGRLRYMSRQPLFIAISLFVLAVMLSTLFADNPYGAFWSNFERGEGGFQMLHYYIFFVLLTVLFTREKDWRTLFWCSLVAGVGMILYGFLAASFVSGFVGPYLQGEGGNAFRLIFSNSRFQGSLGNPAYVAPYLMFIIAYTCWLWWEKKGTRRRTIMFSSLIGFYLIFFVLSETRGAFVGLIAAIFAFLAYMVYAHSRIRKIALRGLIGLAVLGVIVYGLFAGRASLERIPGGRLLSTNLSAISAQTRTWSWGAAWKGFIERPIFGWGPENFSTVFDKHFDPRFFTPGQTTETWFDRAHSLIFDTLVSSGLLGFIAYFSIFGILFYEILKRRRARALASTADGHSIEQVMGTALMVALPIGYLVQGLAIFDVLPIYINLFLFWAFLNYQFALRDIHHE